ncbi:MAG: glycosyltransferase [Candidatus Moraniibacteriota bacterium]
MKHSEISVVVPCYKESSVIEESVLALFLYLRDNFERFEIIIVTDGSPDDTVQKVQTLGRHQPEIPLTLISFKKNYGKGAAVKEGVLASQYDAVLFIDADLTIPVEELKKFIPALETSDIAIASRLVPGSVFEERAPWYRTVLARGFHLLQILLLGNFEYSDTQCGFKLFRRNVARALFEKARVKRFAFDAELLFLAKKMDFSVAVLPVTIKKDTRNTNVDTFRDPINMFGALIKIRWNDLLGKYK